MADTSAKLTIIAELRDAATDGMRRLSNAAGDLTGAMGFAADKTGILASGLAAIGGSTILNSINAFNSAQEKMAKAEGIFDSLPGGVQKFQQAIEAGNKAQAQFGFDNETVTLGLAQFARAAGGDMTQALLAMQAAMGLAVDKFGGADGLESAIAALLPTFAGGSRAVKALGYDVDEHASAQTAFQTVIKATSSELQKWGDSNASAGAKAKAGLGDILENMGEPFGTTIGYLQNLTFGSEKFGQAVESAKPFIEGFGISLAGMSTLMAIRALPQIIATAAGLLGFNVAAELTLATIATTIGVFLFWVVVIGLVIGAFILLGTYLYNHWDQVKKWVIDAWTTAKEKVGQMIDAIVNIFQNWPQVLGEVFGYVVLIWVRLFEGMWKYGQEWVPKIVDGIVTFFAALPAQIASAIATIPSLLVSVFQQAASAIQGVIQGIIGYVASAPSSIVAFGKSALQGFVSNLNSFITGFNSIAGKVGITLPTIPAFADGGIVTRPTIGLIGEAGPEAIIPLSGSRGAGIGGGSVNIYLQGDFYTTTEVAEKFGNELARIIKNQLNLAGVRTA